jgi:hypothetical protein
LIINTKILPNNFLLSAVAAFTAQTLAKQYQRWTRLKKNWKKYSKKL